MNDEMVRAVRQDRVDAAFASGAVFDAPEPFLLEYLNAMSTGHVPNPMVQHREVIRALIINHIQMRRLIDSLDKRNRTTTRWFMVLAVAGVLSAIIQIGLQVISK